jgi:hypothetical protein
MPPEIWQDTVVTLIAAAAAAVLLRTLLPSAWTGGRRRGEQGACASCASGSAACAKPTPTVGADIAPLVLTGPGRQAPRSKDVNP